MTTLPGFWHAAARMTGRVDFSSIFACRTRSAPLDRLSAHELKEGGLRPAQIRILGRTASVEVHEKWITIDSPAYPDRLRCLPYAPPVLFYRGRLELLLRPSLAVVGARRCTASGEAWAMRLARRAVRGRCWRPQKRCDCAPRRGRKHASCVRAAASGADAAAETRRGGRQTTRAARRRTRAADAGRWLCR